MALCIDCIGNLGFRTQFCEKDWLHGLPPQDSAHSFQSVNKRANPSKAALLGRDRYMYLRERMEPSSVIPGFRISCCKTTSCVQHNARC